jgi:hypothetical protein
MSILFFSIYSKFGKDVELPLAYFAAGLPEKDIVIGIGIKWWIKINEIDAGIGKFFRVPSQSRLSPK